MSGPIPACISIGGRLSTKSVPPLRKAAVGRGTAPLAII